MVSTSALLASSQNVTLPPLPELYDANFLDTLLPITEKGAPASASTTEPQPQNALIDALKATSHQTYTTNAAKAFDSTDSPVLDAFQELTPYASGSDIHDSLAKAWAEDPQLTLRIIWNARSIHDGKGEKELFYRAFGWLYKNHPRTAIANLPSLITPVCTRPKKDEGMPHGYWKDLLNILALVMLDELRANHDRFMGFVHNYCSKADGAWIREMYKTELGKLGPNATSGDRAACSAQTTPMIQQAAKERRAKKSASFHELLLLKLREPAFRALYVAVARLFADQIVKDAAVLKQAEGITDAKERKKLLRQLTFVSKWAPTPHGSHDRVTNISSAIALLLHDQGAMAGLSLPVDPSPTRLLSLSDTHVLRSFYKRWHLKPLRDALMLPEVLMSANKWSSIPYSRVPSVCMKNNTERFFTHDRERFTKYMEDVESGKKTISGATLMPHELIGSIMEQHRYLARSPRPADNFASVKAEVRRKLAEQKLSVLEAQWRSMIDRLRESGALENAMAICDVSGSMGSITYDNPRSKQTRPIFPAVALSLVTAQLAKPPFANAIITFSAKPQFITLEPTRSIGDSVEKMVGADWGMNTNFDAVFMDLLLPLAVKHNVPKEDMVKRVFVFSDMQFDEARGEEDENEEDEVYRRVSAEELEEEGVEIPEGMEVWDAGDVGDAKVDDGAKEAKAAGKWQTNHDVIEKAFKAAGYDMPQIVYWNLADSFMTTPVKADRKGVALMNSFSPAMMKVFMGEEDESVLEGEDSWEVTGEKTSGEKTKAEEEFTPLKVMKKALGKKSFDGLVVVD
ncbi:uncharacterized protein STEHIDRAFT_125778 [Stereum hirsutum FP-91666 SS1]|uniref:uncharacterized protein n=1 Tax=Stereum hirsutum (strain FP-91666) TaxID=721885 RepID=UPI0004449D94|nr:uncharacterized protein STEHIDRAFT_125778 [Stereum hirsutum FP-91666 SS1]EIM80777.1 hypothetical protein STEHIDRAFT_125778 [Stereum hirsutum FP-91666 SS1]